MIGIGLHMMCLITLICLGFGLFACFGGLPHTFLYRARAHLFPTIVWFVITELEGASCETSATKDKDFLMFLFPLEQNVLVDRLCDLFA